jgi:hypothetical protein
MKSMMTLRTVSAVKFSSATLTSRRSSAAVRSVGKGIALQGICKSADHAHDVALIGRDLVLKSAVAGVVRSFDRYPRSA